MRWFRLLPSLRASYRIMSTLAPDSRCLPAFFPPVPVMLFSRALPRVSSRPRSRRRAPLRAAKPPPDADDRPEYLDGDALPTDLTLTQKLLMRSYVEQISRMSKEDADRLAIEVMRQTVVKGNILRMMGVSRQEALDELHVPDIEDAVGEGWRWSGEGRKETDDAGDKGKGGSNKGEGGGEGDEGDV